MNVLLSCKLAAQGMKVAAEPRSVPQLQERPGSHGDSLT